MGNKDFGIKFLKLTLKYKKKKDFPNMIKYFLISALDYNNDDALINLGLYYDYIEDYENMIKYYLIAIENNNTESMVLLASYYEKILFNVNRK